MPGDCILHSWGNSTSTGGGPHLHWTRPRIKGTWPSAVNDCGNKHYAQTGMSVIQLVSRLNGRTDGRTGSRKNRQSDIQFLVSRQRQIRLDTEH